VIAAPEPLSAEQIEHERESYKNGYGVNDAAFYARLLYTTDAAHPMQGVHLRCPPNT